MSGLSARLDAGSWTGPTVPGTDEDLARLTGPRLGELLATALAGRAEQLVRWRLL